MDLGRFRIEIPIDLLKIAEKNFSERLQKIGELSSREIIRLLMPFEKGYGMLIPSERPAPFFIGKYPKLPELIRDEDAVTLYDLIIEPECYKIIENDTARRLRKTSEKNKLIFKFYGAVIKQFRTRKFDPDAINKIIDPVTGPVLEELRTISRRLSVHAFEPFEEALQNFEFELPAFPKFPGLNLKDLLDSLNFDDDDDDDEGEDFDDEDMADEALFDDFDDLSEKVGFYLSNSEAWNAEDIKEEVKAMMDTFENFIDGMDLRTAPSFALKQFKQFAKSDKVVAKKMERIGEFFRRAEAIPRLSREAQLILYGKEKGRR
jgi:hypothetical protein